jgi:predicted metal-dependent peptidase
MLSNQESIYAMETIESIIANPDSSWKTLFKETVISMIASNKNELLWYANFLSRCEYEYHFNESFTSAVYFNGKNFVITINPVILGIIEKDQMIAILKHSAGHIINHHFSRSTKEDNTNKEVVETAKDIVINGSRDVPYIKDLPATGSYKNSPIQAFFYQTLTEKYGIENYEVGREFEYYVALMVEAQKDIEENNPSCSHHLEEDFDDEINMQLDFAEDTDENSEPSQNGEENDANDETGMESDSSQERDENNASSENSDVNDSDDEENMESGTLSERTLEALESGACNIDSHEFGEQLQEAVGLDDSLLDSFMDRALNEMINDSTSFARGYTPSEAMEAQHRIEKRESHKDWRKIFNKKMRNYLTNSFRYREPNKSRQHPIYPDDFDLYGYSPGKKPKLGVVLDVSGSVDDRLLSALMSEIQAIQKKYSIKSVTLVQVDAEIKSIEKFGVHDKFIVRHGGGGTMMEPGFSVLLKQSTREIPDIIICATDGDIEEKFVHVKVPNRVQVIWLIDKEGKLLFDTSKYPKQQMHVIAFSV